MMNVVKNPGEYAPQNMDGVGGGDMGMTEQRNTYMTIGK